MKPTTDKQCPVCQGGMYGPWCSECEAWTGIPPASDEMVAAAKKEAWTKVSGSKTVALIKRIEQEQAGRDFADGSTDGAWMVAADLRVRLDCQREQHAHALASRTTLLAEALPWLQDEQVSLWYWLECNRHGSPQRARTEASLEEVSATIAKIEALGSGGLAIRKDAEPTHVASDSPGATCPRCDGPGATNVYSDGRACPFCGATIDAGDDEEGDD